MLANRKDNMSVEEINSFQAVDEGFSMREAIAEAKKCLQCKIPQCRKGCPIENEIPSFIHALSMGNMGDAMHIINEKVIFRLFVGVFVHMKSSARVIV